MSLILATSDLESCRENFNAQSMEDFNDDPQGRRREQVRKAQKTHRARKAVYVKSLETEVTELRKEKAMNLNMIRQLQSLLLQNGIPLPSGLGSPSSSNRLTAINLIGNKRAQQAVEAHLPSAGTGTCTYDDDQCSHNDGNSTDSYGMNTSPPPSVGITFRHAAHVQGLDSTQVAVNFILALEQPCLHHHKKPSPELLVTGSIGTGHEAMLSSPIMQRSPSYSLNPLKIGYTAGAQWAIPTAELEALLQSSNKLPLTTEITPIQIWNILKNNPRFNYVTFEQLELFRQTLFPLIKCYGFGAVIDSASFNQLLGNLFSAI